MIREFSVELTQDDARMIGYALAKEAANENTVPPIKPGRKTFAFDQNALMVVADGDFNRFLWAAFDRVEERDGIICLAKGKDVTFFLPVTKLHDPEIRRAIWNFVTERVALNG